MTNLIVILVGLFCLGCLLFIFLYVVHECEKEIINTRKEYEWRRRYSRGEISRDEFLKGWGE